MTTTNTPHLTLTKSQTKQIKIIKEIKSTESTYLSTLETLRENKKLLSEKLIKKEILLLFCNLDDLYFINSELFSEICLCFKDLEGLEISELGVCEDRDSGEMVRDLGETFDDDGSVVEENLNSANTIVTVDNSSIATTNDTIDNDNTTTIDATTPNNITLTVTPPTNCTATTLPHPPSQSLSPDTTISTAISNLSKTFIKLAPFLKIYSQFIKNFKNSLSFLDTIQPHLKSLKINKFELSSNLLSIIQRIPRYKLLFLDLLKSYESTSTTASKLTPSPNTVSSYSDTLSLLTTAVNKISELAIWVNSSIKDTNIEKLIYYSKHLEILPHRKFIKESSLKKICRKSIKQRVLVLFSDYILYGSINISFVLHLKVRIDGCRIKKSEAGFLLLCEAKSFEFVCGEYEADEWVRLVCEAQEQLRENRTRSVLRYVSSTNLSNPPNLSKNPTPSNISLNPTHISLNSSAFENSSSKFFETTSGNPLKPVWIPDNQSNKCMICSELFSLYKRRHHCRKCGCLCCFGCFLVFYGEKVCVYCFNGTNVNGVSGTSVVTGPKTNSGKYKEDYKESIEVDGSVDEACSRLESFVCDNSSDSSTYQEKSHSNSTSTITISTQIPNIPIISPLSAISTTSTTPLNFTGNSDNSKVIEEVVFEGNLLKRGNKYKNLKYRYVVVSNLRVFWFLDYKCYQDSLLSKSVNEENRLTGGSFSSNGGKADYGSLGYLWLENCYCVEYCGVDFGFVLKFNGKSGKGKNGKFSFFGRELVLVARSEKEREEWVGVVCCAVRDAHREE